MGQRYGEVKEIVSSVSFKWSYLYYLYRGFSVKCRTYHDQMKELEENSKVSFRMAPRKWPTYNRKVSVVTTTNASLVVLKVVDISFLFFKIHCSLSIILLYPISINSLLIDSPIFTKLVAIRNNVYRKIASIDLKVYRSNFSVHSMIPCHNWMRCNRHVIDVSWYIWLPRKLH